MNALLELMSSGPALFKYNWCCWISYFVNVAINVSSGTDGPEIEDQIDP